MQTKRRWNAAGVAEQAMQALRASIQEMERKRPGNDAIDVRRGRTLGGSLAPRWRGRDGSVAPRSVVGRLRGLGLQVALDHPAQAPSAAPMR